MRNVAVIDASGHVLATYPIVIRIAGEPVDDQKYFDIARQNAIDDGLVSQNDAANLQFEFVSQGS